MDEKTADAVIALGKLSLEFGRINRTTLHDDKVTPESDTDHTVMLGLIACALAAKYEPTLNIGKIAMYAFVHDLVEVYAGDTPTYGMGGDTSKTDKAEREAAALERIQQEFGDTLPWLHETIEEYEALATPEACFVKTIDKSLPKLTHILNGGASEPDWSGFVPHCTKQREVLATSYAKEQGTALSLFDWTFKKARAILRV
jgi:5'-deoxynucleotidase YfbR-like HD superfamily hydrolase